MIRDICARSCPPLLDPQVGMVTCVYRGKNAAGFFSGLTAIGMSVEMTAGVLVANLLEGMKFGLGPTTVVRKDSLASIGGYTALRDYIAYDFAIGNLIAKAGYRVVLSGHIIDHVVNQKSFRRMWQNQLRWAQTTRYSRPKGHFGSGLIFAMPYGLLGFLAAAGLGHWGIGAVLLGVAVLNRLAEAWLVGWMVVRDPQVRRAPWLYPLRDLLGFAVWFASYLNLRYVWRDSRFELKGTRIALRQTSSDRDSHWILLAPGLRAFDFLLGGGFLACFSYGCGWIYRQSYGGPPSLRRPQRRRIR